MSRFADYLRFERHYSAHTVAAYTSDVSVFFLDTYPGEELDAVIAQVTPRDVRSWVMCMVKDEKAPRSVNRAMSSLQTFFRFAELLGLREGNPVMGLPRPKIPKRLPSFLREEEMDRLLDRSQFSDDFPGMRDRLLLLLLYSTGLRRGEVVQLRWSDWDARSNSVRVRGKGDKDRVVPLTRELSVELVEYRELQRRYADELGCVTDRLFVTNDCAAVTGDWVYRTVNTYFSRCTTGSCSGPHALRHTFATHMLQGGADIVSIKELLGHESLGTTQVYTHTDVGVLKRAYASCHPHAARVHAERIEATKIEK